MMRAGSIHSTSYLALLACFKLGCAAEAQEPEGAEGLSDELMKTGTAALELKSTVAITTGALSAGIATPATSTSTTVSERAKYPAIAALAKCTHAGAQCCPPDAEVPTVHCLDAVCGSSGASSISASSIGAYACALGDNRLGCNVETGLCERCGDPGEVCCDGPLTGFSGKSYTGAFMPEKVEACEQPAACDTKLVDGKWSGPRICERCGDSLGGACCPPDVRYALGRCLGTDGYTGARLTCNDPWADVSTCIACGQGGMPPCNDRTPCDPAIDPQDNGGFGRGGLTVRDGICVPCGWAGLPSCDGTCEDYYHYDARTDMCVEAGGADQPCADGPNKCHYEGMVCDAQKICRRTCGMYQQDCCRGTCDAGLECRDVKGRSACAPSQAPRIPPVPKPVPPPMKTCGGNLWGIYTQTHYVPVQQAYGCVIGIPFAANSYAEALGCARAGYGNSALDEAVGSYTFGLASAFGCNNVTVLSTGDDDAAECAASQCINCSVLPGGCF